MKSLLYDATIFPLQFPTHLPFKWQTRFELLPSISGIFYVNKLLLDRGWVIEGDLPAPVGASYCGPNVHSASEMLRDVCRHHVFYTYVKIYRTINLPEISWKKVTIKEAIYARGNDRGQITTMNRRDIICPRCQQPKSGKPRSLVLLFSLEDGENAARRQEQIYLGSDIWLTCSSPYLWIAYTKTQLYVNASKKQ